LEKHPDMPVAGPRSYKKQLFLWAEINFWISDEIKQKTLEALELDRQNKSEKQLAG